MQPPDWMWPAPALGTIVPSCLILNKQENTSLVVAVGKEGFGDRPSFIYYKWFNSMWIKAIHTLQRYLPLPWDTAPYKPISAAGLTWPHWAPLLQGQQHRRVGNNRRQFQSLLFSYWNTYYLYFLHIFVGFFAC